MQLTGGECSRLLPHRTPMKVLFLKKLDPITSPSAKCFHFWWGHFVYNVQHDELRSRDILLIMNEIKKQLYSDGSQLLSDTGMIRLTYNGKKTCDKGLHLV